MYHLSCRSLGVVQLLLETKKVNVDSIDIYGWTPLSYATENGYEGIVELLLQAKKTSEG
jgi:ankyrin repeat protein